VVSIRCPLSRNAAVLLAIGSLLGCRASAPIHPASPAPAVASGTGAGRPAYETTWSYRVIHDDTVGWGLRVVSRTAAGVVAARGVPYSVGLFMILQSTSVRAWGSVRNRLRTNHRVERARDRDRPRAVRGVGDCEGQVVRPRYGGGADLVERDGASGSRPPAEGRRGVIDVDRPAACGGVEERFGG
jgi:hypothetical protein